MKSVFTRNQRVTLLTLGLIILFMPQLLILKKPFLFTGDAITICTDTDPLTPDPINIKWSPESRQDTPASDAYRKVNTRNDTIDPNTLDSLGFIKAGFSSFATGNILKYRRSGGWFRVCKDLFRMYGIDSLLVEDLLPVCKCSPGIREKPLHTPLDINAADSIEWQRIKGIGPVYASRITRYRDRLGGFHKVEQLSEVYGLTDSFVNANRHLLLLNTEHRRFDLNRVKYSDLRSHYYFDNKVAGALIKYRTQHGPYQSVAEIKKIRLLTDSIYSRILPYLMTGPADNQY